MNQENPYEPPSQSNVSPTIIDQSEKQSLASMVNAEKNYENFLLEKIFKISDILGQVSKREQDIKEVVNFMSETHQNIKA